MGRWRAEAVIIRRMPEVTITFFDRETIYAFPKGYANGTIFHRWYAPRGSYGRGWEQFRRKLLRYKHLDLAKCHELADEHGILYIGTDRTPKLKQKKVKYLEE